METIITKRNPTVTQTDVKKYPVILMNVPARVAKFNFGYPSKTAGEGIISLFETKSLPNGNFDMVAYHVQTGAYDNIEDFKNVIKWVKENVKKPNNDMFVYTNRPLKTIVEIINLTLGFHYSLETFICLYNPRTNRKIVRKYEYSSDAPRRGKMQDSRLIAHHQEYLANLRGYQDTNKVSLESNRMNQHKKSPVKKGNTLIKSCKRMTGDVTVLGKNFNKLI